MHSQSLTTATTMAVATSLTIAITKELMGDNVASSLQDSEMTDSALADLASTEINLALPNFAR